MPALPRRDALLLAEVEGLLAGLVEASGDCTPAARAEAARMMLRLGLRGLAAAEGTTTAAAYLQILAERLLPAAVEDGDACRCQVVWAEPGAPRPAEHET